MKRLNPAELNNESTRPEPLSSKDLALLRVLDLAAQITGKEPTLGEAEFWKQELSGYSENEIDSAFKDHLRRSKYFPKLAEILDLIRESRKSEPYPYTGPWESDEDRRRKAAGWRQYGVPDVKCLTKIHADTRAKLNRPLTEKDENEMLNELDRRIDALGKSREAGE